MKSLFFARARGQSIGLVIALVLAVSASLLSVVLALHYWKTVPIGWLTRDPNAVAEAPSYIGFLSQAGIFFWAAAASACLLSATHLSGGRERHTVRRFLISSGLLTLLLGLDDAFQGHEIILPRLGVPERAVYLIYGGIILHHLVTFRRTILNTEYVLLGMALFFFGASVTFDWFWVTDLESALFLFEDGTKLVGIVSWTAYHLRVGAFALRPEAVQEGVRAEYVPAQLEEPAAATVALEPGGTKA